MMDWQRQPQPKLTPEELRITRLMDVHMFQSAKKCTGTLVPDDPPKYNGFYYYRCALCGASLRAI
jgi:hypothetical protein